MTSMNTAADGTPPDFEDRPVLFMLHGLGLDARSWDFVAAELPEFRCVSIDLPGFGDAIAQTGYAVTAMADHVEAVIRTQAPTRWGIVGHSMGAKVACVVARRAEGPEGLSGLAAIILLAGSPPSSEPLEEKRRQTMLGWFEGDEAQCRVEAETFIDANVSRPLSPDANRIAIESVLRSNVGAWRNWLTEGSLEDLSDQVGRLSTSALLVAGGDDGDLGADAQSTAARRFFSNADMAILHGAKHFLQMERPAEVASLISEHWSKAIRARFDPIYTALLASDRVSARTRAVLHKRTLPDEPNRQPKMLNSPAYETLRAVISRVLPQDPRRQIDIAARIDAALATGTGDGWRFASLPPDRRAFQTALTSLDEVSLNETGCRFEALDAGRQDAFLERMTEGTLEAASPGLFTARQMELWFEDLRAQAVKAYMSHPSTLARIGYSGVANGGDGARKQGFTAVGVGEREGWEPRACRL